MRKLQDFLKALVAFAVIMVLLLVLVLLVISEFTPRLIPDWVYTVGAIISIPFWIAFFTVIFKEWQKQRKAKKEK